VTYQLYFLTIVYLLLGSALFLVDEYGGRYLLLLRLKNFTVSKAVIPLTFSIAGIILGILKIFITVKPGPPLLGDLVPTFFLFVVAFYQLILFVRIVRFDKSVLKRQKEALDKTGSFIEQYKRNLGFTLLIVATLHFLFPGAILL